MDFLREVSIVVSSHTDIVGRQNCLWYSSGEQIESHSKVVWRGMNMHPSLETADAYNTHNCCDEIKSKQS